MNRTLLDLLSAAMALVFCAMLFSSVAFADELTLMIEKDLQTLGYATGPVDGEETMETAIAISKFQAENNREVTGTVSPQLAGILSARVENPAARPAYSDSVVTSAEATTDPAALQAEQQACLQEKVAASQASQKKKRGLGRLVSAVARTAGRSGNNDLYETTRAVYDANATAGDLAAAAKDLGLTEDDVQACQNPG